MQGSQHVFDEALAPPPTLEKPLFVELDLNPDQDEETPMALSQASSETMHHGAQRLQRADPDTIEYHQAMKESDRAQFIWAIVREVNTHTERKHWSLIQKDQVPEGLKVLSAI
eukprot:1741938-Ditylum_brightwellii.AAC.1